MEEINIGLKVKQLRKKKELSVRKMASMAGITASMLSQIESEQVNPSINTLKMIAKVLETPLYAFFMNESTHGSVVTPETRISLGLEDGSDTRYELLTPDTKGDIEFCLMVIPPNRATSAKVESHTGEEVAFMLSGLEVELERGDEVVYLRQGESVRIEAGVGHCWRNYSKNEVQVIFAITPPSF